MSEHEQDGAPQAGSADVVQGGAPIERVREVALAFSEGYRAGYDRGESGEAEDGDSAWDRSRASAKLVQGGDGPAPVGAAVVKDLREWLRESVRTRLLFGCFDEPLDDAGCRVVRAIIDRLPAPPTAGAASIGPADETCPHGRAFDMHCCDCRRSGVFPPEQCRCSCTEADSVSAARPEGEERQFQPLEWYDSCPFCSHYGIVADNIRLVPCERHADQAHPTGAQEEER
jgi:hypothetical protein